MQQPAIADDRAPSLALRAALGEFEPLLRRAADLDPQGLVRFQAGAALATATVRLPFKILVARTVALPTAAGNLVIDTTVALAAALAWINDVTAPAPAARDAEWRWAVAPLRGWQRLDTVPEAVVRDVVRTGALAVRDTGARIGRPDAQPPAAAVDALLDSPVLTVSAAGHSDVELPLRALTAITRMGFVPRDSDVGVDVTGRWVRLAGRYGAGYIERPGAGLGLLS